MSDDRRAASLVGLHGGWRLTGMNTKTLMEPSSNSPSLEHRKLQFSDSFRFFILKTPATFTNVSPFLIEKAITGAIGEVKSIRKMRSGDLFLEVSSSNQATAGWTGAEHKAPHPDLSTPDLPQTVKMATSVAQFDRTSQIRCAAFSANDTATRRTSVGASLPALVAGNQATTAQIVKRRSSV
ncbi:hypothetical protein TNCV_3947101 [Trichonephila clavipes]|nr:hypothetical protein TNCV_3947101 [Trichonephila clavipes]